MQILTTSRMGLVLALALLLSGAPLNFSPSKLSLETSKASALGYSEGGNESRVK